MRSNVRPLSMPDPEPRPDPTRLRIVHCVRAPIGGIFRHVLDLARAQAAAGHRVGLICDASTGGAFEDAQLAAIEPVLALELTRLPMRRRIGPRDVAAAWRILRLVRSIRPDVIHGHGAKGGAYGRIIGTFLRAGGRPVVRVYCPHGGSIHYAAGSLRGRAYFLLERILAAMTDAFVFVSRYEADSFATKVGTPSKPAHLIHNGLGEAEFRPVTPESDARDFLFIGMMRALKGPDLFVEALARVGQRLGRPVTAHMVGAGDDRDACERRVRELGLDAVVRFHEPMPARDAFAMARAVVVPSRAESMPYVVLEAAAAAMPIVATRVGGIPEILDDGDDRLVAPDDADALADAMLDHLADPEGAGRRAEARVERIRERFSLGRMATAIEGVYRDGLRPGIDTRRSPEPPGAAGLEEDRTAA